MPMPLIPDPINPMAGLAPGRNINPMMGSQMPQQAPANPMMQPQQQQQPTGGGGLMANLFGGQQGQNLPTQSRRQLGRDALFNAGLSLLESSGPNAEGFTATSLQGLGRSLGAGRETFGAGVADAKARAALEQREQILSRADKTTEGRREAFQQILVNAVASGDPTRITNAKMALDATPDPDEFDYETVGDRLLQFNAQGELVGSFNEQIAEMIASMTPEQAKLVLPIQNQFESKVRSTRDVANSFRRVRSATQTLLDFQARKREAESRGEEFDETRPTAAAMAAISSFARLLDPGSVVREGEFRIVTDQGSLKDRIHRWWTQITQGVIPDGLAQALQDEARRQTQSQQATFEEAQEEYFRRIRAQAGVERTPDIEATVINPFTTALIGSDFANSDDPGLAPIPILDLDAVNDEAAAILGGQ